MNENAGDAPVLCEVDDGIATVILNRPQRMNAWTHAMEVAYFDLIDALDDDPAVRVVVLTGAGRGSARASTPATSPRAPRVWPGRRASTGR